jgi:dTDP-4-amino-4,6-dideoxygalactose transaminase
MCFTNDDKKSEVMRSLLVHGKGSDKYDNIRIGINGRLDTLQAAILLAKFEIFSEEIELRQQVAKNYTNLLSHNPWPITPYLPNGMRSAWAQYSILAKDNNHRSVLLKRLQDNKIPTAIYYPKPLHLQTAFTSLGYKEGDFSVSEDMAGRIFSLPMHPYLTEEDQRRIVNTIKQI